MAKTTSISVKIADLDPVRDRLREVAEAIETLQSKLYDACVLQFDDPAEIGVEVSHETGKAWPIPERNNA